MPGAVVAIQTFGDLLSFFSWKNHTLPGKSWRKAIIWEGIWVPSVPIHNALDDRYRSWSLSEFVEFVSKWVFSGFQNFKGLGKHIVDQPGLFGGNIEKS